MNIYSKKAMEINFQERSRMDEKLQEIMEQQPDDEILYDLAELFKIFGDSTRIKILYVLSENELCVKDRKSVV